MEHYAITKITTKLTEEMKNTILTLIDSGRYHMRYYNAIDKTFMWPVRDEMNFFAHLSARHPEIEIEIESWYEAYHYDGTFIRGYKNGNWIREDIRIDYYFEWAARIDTKIKKYIEEELTSHFHKFDKAETRTYTLIDTNEDRTISHSIVLRTEDDKDIMNEEVRYPIKYEAIKQGTNVFVSIGFLFQSETIDTNNEEIETIDNSADTNSEGFVPINDNDLPF